MAKAISIEDRLAALEGGGMWSTVAHWVRANQITIGASVGILVLLVGGSLYWQHQKNLALTSLRRGIAAIQSGDAQKAISELQNTGSSSLGDVERALGLLYLGDALVLAGKKDDAVKSYADALVVVRRGKPGTYLEQLLLVKAGQMAEVKGADADARQKYEQAAEIVGPLQIEALAVAARLAEKLNDSAGARVHYEKLASVDAMHPLAEVFQGKSEK